MEKEINNSLDNILIWEEQINILSKSVDPIKFILHRIPEDEISKSIIKKNLISGLNQLDKKYQNQILNEIKEISNQGISIVKEKIKKWNKKYTFGYMEDLYWYIMIHPEYADVYIRDDFSNDVKYVPNDKYLRLISHDKPMIRTPPYPYVIQYMILYSANDDSRYLIKYRRDEYKDLILNELRDIEKLFDYYKNNF